MNYYVTSLWLDLFCMIQKKRFWISLRPECILILKKKQHVGFYCNVKCVPVSSKMSLTLNLKRSWKQTNK